VGDYREEANMSCLRSPKDLIGAARESYEGCEARRLREPRSEVSPFGWPH
jgi:hypothetical protein